MAGPDAVRAEDAPEPAPAKPVDLDRLLKLPSSVQYDVEKRGGATRTEWRARYATARSELADARDGLAKSQKALEQGASNTSQWSVAPPGVPSTPDVSANYPLTQEVKRQREAMERAEKKLRDLDVEANLAAVPQEWRAVPAP